MYAMVASVGKVTVRREGATLEAMYSAIKDISVFAHKIIVLDFYNNILYSFDDTTDKRINNKRDWNPRVMRAATEEELALNEWSKVSHVKFGHISPAIIQECLDNM